MTFSRNRIVMMEQKGFGGLTVDTYFGVLSSDGPSGCG